MHVREFSMLLVKARKERRLTQEQACLLIGIADTSTLSKWETVHIFHLKRWLLKLYKLMMSHY